MKINYYAISAPFLSVSLAISLLHTYTVVNVRNLLMYVFPVDQEKVLSKYSCLLLNPQTNDWIKGILLQIFHSWKECIIFCVRTQCEKIKLNPNIFSGCFWMVKGKWQKKLLCYQLCTLPTKFLAKFLLKKGGHFSSFHTKVFNSTFKFCLYFHIAKRCHLSWFACKIANCAL